MPFLFCTICFAADRTQTATVSGKLVSSTGDPIKLTGSNGEINFYTSTGGSASFSAKEINVQSDGTFYATVTFDPTAGNNPGQYYLYYRTDEENSLNVLPDYKFFYTEGAETSSKSYGKGTLLDLRSGDISGLELVVDTGWTLTGNIRMHEDAYLTGISDGNLGSLYFGLRSADSTYPNLYSSAIFLKNGVREWTYRVILPKTPLDCTLMQGNIQVYSAQLSTLAETNLYTGSLDIADLKISGDMQLPDLILSPAKATITPRFTVQEYSQTTIR